MGDASCGAKESDADAAQACKESRSEILLGLLAVGQKQGYRVVLKDTAGQMLGSARVAAGSSSAPIVYIR